MLWVFKLIKASRLSLHDWIYAYYYTVNSNPIVLIQVPFNKLSMASFSIRASHFM